MTEATARHRGPRGPRLTRERIVQTALAIIDEAGMDGLGMRRLGGALGVDPMAVYHHFPNKRAIVRSVVEVVFAGFRAPPARGSWPAQVRSWARAYRRLALAHRDLLLAVVADEELVAVAAGSAGAPLAQALRGAGLREDDLDAAISAIVDYTHGTVLPATAGTPSPEMERAFEQGLEIILEGVASRASGGTGLERDPVPFG